MKLLKWMVGTIALEGLVLSGAVMVVLWVTRTSMP